MMDADVKPTELCDDMAIFESPEELSGEIKLNEPDAPSAVKDEIMPEVVDQNTAEASDDEQNLGELNSTDSVFVGFSPVSSPMPTFPYQTVKKLESEIELLSEKLNIFIENEIKPEPTEQDASHLTTDKRRGSRGSSPAESVSSHGSIRRSLSVSSRDSKKSAINEKKMLEMWFLPFEKGWKREVNVTSLDTIIVYIHPLGLRLKSLQDLSLHLTDGLTIDNFTFSPDTLNAGPDNEIIINHPPPPPPETREPPPAPASVPPPAADNTQTPSVRKSGRVPVPSSNYKIVERMEEESRKRGGPESPMAPPHKREKLVIKLKQSRPPTPTSNGAPAKAAWSTTGTLYHHPSAPKGPLRKVTGDNPDKPPAHSRKTVRKKMTSVDSSNYSMKRSAEETGWSPAKSGDEEPRRVCSIGCPLAMGLIPSLQCCVCLCLYHPECAEVGRTGSARLIHRYICKSCRGKPEARKASGQAEPAAQPPAPPPPVPPPPAPAVSQTILTLNRRRFVMVPNLSATAASSTQPPGPALPQQSAALPLADLPTSEPTTAVKPEGASLKKFTLKKPTENNMANFMTHICSGYVILLDVFKHLSIPDILRASRVCHLWKSLSEDPKLWETVRINNSAVRDWSLFSSALARRGTKWLDLRDDVPLVDNVRNLGSISTLQELEIGKISLDTLGQLLLNLTDLGICTAKHVTHSNEASASLEFTTNHKLEVLRIRMADGEQCGLRTISLRPLAASLRVLSLLNFTDWSSTDLSSLESLTSLTDLQVGECSTLDLSFSQALPTITRLERLRLENGKMSIEIMASLSQLPSLTHLELINFDLPPEFNVALANLRNLKALLLIPSFVTQAGTKLSSVLRGIYQLRETLSLFVWVFTREFVQVADLFIDKYAQPKIGKSGQATTSSCVPMLMPLPIPEDKSGDPSLWEDVEQRYGDTESGTIGVVPIPELIAMLEAGMPNTRIFVNKLPADKTTSESLQKYLASGAGSQKQPNS